MSHCYCRIISEKHSRCNTMLHNLTSEIQTKLILTSQKKYNRTGGPHCSKGFSHTWHSVLSSYSEYFADQILTCDYKCEIWVSNVSKPTSQILTSCFTLVALAAQNQIWWQWRWHWQRVFSVAGAIMGKGVIGSTVFAGLGKLKLQIESARKSTQTDKVICSPTDGVQER